MAGQTAVPDDFACMGEAEIEPLFGVCASARAVNLLLTHDAVVARYQRPIRLV